MGALHRGHLALIDQGRRLAGKRGLLAVSLFVNPMQFGPAEDFSRYPRPFARDRRLCAEHGVDLIFHPSPRQMYAEDHSIVVEETSLSTGLCGASRPGHFRGVCTVVLKLFNILRPSIAVFGEKDYQQLAIMRRMVRDLNLPVRIVAGKTVRERDGLALSSRNQYLTQGERADAPLIRRGLQEAAAAVRGGLTDPAGVRQVVADRIGKSTHARIDYIEIVNARSLAPLARAGRGSVIATAVFFGRTRLIDNIYIP
jgi:pantoate--beta-alanine ligase